MKKTKVTKREEAQTRQKRYNSLSLEEKLFQIEMRRGESKKEAKRLTNPKSKWRKELTKIWYEDGRRSQS